MKKTTIKVSIIWLLTFFMSSCMDESLREDLNNLQQEVNNNKSTIELLQQNNNINFIEYLDTSYKIHFADNTFIEVSNGQDGEDGVDGINGTNGQDGSDAPYIVEITETDTHFIFKFSDDSIIETPVNLEFKRIACWGDSLTAQGFPAILQQLLGSDEYGVLNKGVGGENSLTIAARQGGIPMYLKNQIEIPATTDVTIELGERTSTFLSSYNNSSIITPLLQGGNSSINNCIINNIECKIRWTGTIWNDPDGRYTLARITEGTARTTTENSIIFTGAMRTNRNYHANVFFVGQNGGYSGYEDLTIQINKMVEFSNSSNYIVIGLHTQSKAYRNNLENKMLNEFGARYINLREYLSTYGLEDAGLTPTEEDITAMNSGTCPPQLLSGDGVHFNSTSSNLVAKLIQKRLYTLGIIE